MCQPDHPSSIKGPGSVSVFGDFFGEYLLKHEAISQDQLDEAIFFQQKNNELLGKLAQKKGYMHQAQIKVVLQEQRRTNRNFGQVAVHMEFLDQAQLETLLQEQAKNHVLLGEALTRLGTLSIDQLNVLINAYLHKLQDDEEHFDRCIQLFPHAPICRQALALVREYFFRLGYVLKVRDVERNPTLNTYDPVFLVRQKLELGYAYFGLQLSWRVISFMAEPWKEVGEFSKTRMHTFEIVSEIVDNLNQVLCKELEEMGYSALPGELCFEIPKKIKEAVKITFYSFLDPVILLYYTV